MDQKQIGFIVWEHEHGTIPLAAPVRIWGTGPEAVARKYAFSCMDAPPSSYSDANKVMDVVAVRASGGKSSRYTITLSLDSRAWAPGSESTP